MALVPLDYWRAALAEVSLCHPQVPPDDKPIAIAQQDGRWRVTDASSNINAWVSKQFSDSMTGNKENADGRPVKTIPFVLIAARLSAQVTHGVKSQARDLNEGFSLLCIPCLLDREGGLLPAPDRQPWIPRDMLTPSLEEVTVGDLDSQDKFLSSIPGKPTTLSDAFQTAARLFREVTGAGLPLLSEHIEGNSDLPGFEREGYEVVSAWHGLPYSPPIIAKHLIKLYDQLIAKTPLVPLLDKLRDTADRPARAPILPDQSVAKTRYAALVGHIDKEYALSLSQREAMSELVALQSGDVLAVNGPPGTGKTTLLHSVVAQLWVDAALQRAECPLIVVTSTNVKAVENVLDSFAKIALKTQHERWIPYQGGFGLFMASASRETKFPTYTGDTHPFVEYETADGVASARTEYLRHAHATAYVCEEQRSVEAVVEALHAELTNEHKTLQNIIKTRYAIFEQTGLDSQTGAVALCTRFISQYKRDAEAAKKDFEVACAIILHNHEFRSEVEANYETARTRINDAERGWSEYIAASPLWLDLLFFLSPVLRRRNARDRAFLLTNLLTAEVLDRRADFAGHFGSLRRKALTDQQAELKKLDADLARATVRKTAAVARESSARKDCERINALLGNWRAALGTKYQQMEDVSVEALNDKLDTLLRARMFCIADRYWSGMWLLEMQERLSNQITDSKGLRKLEMKYRRFAKLSPCFVSNFHMAPSYFTAWQGESLPMWDKIDLLIVDEAGQVSPDIGACMFALAKRALVVGDTYQIEPIWSIGEATDRANAVKFGLTARDHDPRYDTLTIAGYTTAQGNLMKIAGRSCNVQKYDDVRGLLLTEHRRCVPELIAYCNALVYCGRLQPVRPALDPATRLLPAFGRLEVQGKDSKVGTSRQNYAEAEAIVAWLKENRVSIERHYRDKKTGESVPLWKLVGVVTPFSTQANLIGRLLRKVMPDLVRKDTKLTVGTVHALQGAERDIVIFSPTYGQDYNGGVFFDRSPNMLNVAVSRAKDSFLVIGNLSLFDQTKRSKPSGLLAKYLFDPINSGVLSCPSLPAQSVRVRMDR